jgi:hypothetical protein
MSAVCGGLRHLPNDLAARLVCWPRGSFDAVLVQPERLRFDEVDTVFRFVGAGATAFAVEGTGGLAKP